MDEFVPSHANLPKFFFFKLSISKRFHFQLVNLAAAKLAACGDKVGNGETHGRKTRDVHVE